MTEPTTIQHCRAELARLERKLAEVYEYMDRFKRATDESVQIVKQRLIAECTSRMTKLAIKSLVLAVGQAERTGTAGFRQAWDWFHEVKQNVMEPLVSSRMKALDMLREIHDPNTCVHCEDKNPCHKGRASLIMRDLIIMTICIFQPTPAGGGTTNSWRSSCGKPVWKAATTTR